jgi:deoxyadenosine/deoxycytidine kinase
MCVIWIEGIIGAGKSTLTEKVCSSLNLRPLYEPVDSNPYLELFYKEPSKYAFAMQMELLYRRYAMQQLASYESVSGCGYKGAVLDRGLPGDRVFAKMLMLSGHISELEWNTYCKAYDIMTNSLRPPSMMIYLDVEPSVALQRIKSRSRGAEVNIDIEYLESLKNGYYDLMVEISSGKHGWSKGIEVVKIPWNVDHQDPMDIIKIINNRL